MTKRVKKTQQQEEGETLVQKFFNLFTRRKYKIRSATMIDEMGVKGGKRLIIYIQEKDK